MQLHHVQVLCPAGAEPEARAFYGEALGLREIPRPPTLEPGGLWYELDDGRQIHIGVRRPGDEPARSRAHFALRTTALAALLQRLDSAGITPAPAPHIDGWERCYVRDPFGNVIELLQITTDPTES